MRIQKALRLEISRVKGTSQHEHLFQQRLINGKESLKKTEPAKLFADLLKRKARTVCQDVTNCQPEQIAAHIARLDDLREIFTHALRYQFNETGEAILSDFPLNSTYTLADHLEAMNHTRKTHRCPAFVNWRDSELAMIHQKLDMLAGHVAGLNTDNFCPNCKMRLEGGAE